MDERWLPRFGAFGDAAPHARLLSNGRLTALLTSAGTGYAAWGETRLTAWEGDRTEDADGWFIYLRDLDSGRHWSAGYLPLPGEPGACAARYTPGCVTLTRRAADIESALAVCVAPDVDAEVRRLTLINHAARPRRIEITAYLEVVLNDPTAHAAHPAFAKLFVETELAARDTLLARRRPRSHGEAPPWMTATLLGVGALHVETDRARFVGRNGSLAAPQALATDAQLSGTVGSVLDPVFALRGGVVLAPGAQLHAYLLLGAGEDRAAALGALARAAAPEALASVFDRAAAHEAEVLRSVGIEARTAEAYQELAGAMAYGHPALRADAATIARARGATAQLGQFGLGSALFAVVAVEQEADCQQVEALLAAQSYWLHKGWRVDVVLLCGTGVDAAALARRARDTPAAVVVRRRAELSDTEVDLLLAAAQLVVRGGVPSLTAAGPAPEMVAGPAPAAPSGEAGQVATEPLRFDNGVGGFSADGSEYVVRISREQRPPLAWVNVIANEVFGCIVSESGAACTWSRNSREHRLTPWFNDPLRDPHGEALYVRDEDSGAFWSPQPGPAPATAAAYETRHGFGYTMWRHSSHALEQEVVVFVPRHEPVRIARVRLTNLSPRARRLSVYAYQRLVLGGLAAESGRYVVTRHDGEHGVLLAHNRLAGELSDGEAFAAAVIEDRTARVAWTTDRTAFIGRYGSPSAPAALLRPGVLDGRSGAALDPCFALQITCEVSAAATVECAFLLGETVGDGTAQTIVDRYRRLADLDAALDAVRAFWSQTLTAVQVETPVPAIDLMVNGWLLYQALSCRLWGRSALYQSGGAFGFRDQLQDAAALVWAQPALTRAQIVLHAAHQFVEGDVLHWWHPPADRGTRTRFADDLLWLPYVACFYARATGDWSVFDAGAGFLAARALEPGEDEAYLEPAPAGETADVYAHCCRAIDRSLGRGAHGLPLMGTGDWNDGMNRVGREGRGESVWLGFFLAQVLADFIPVCERRADRKRARRYAAHRRALVASLNAAGWDGAWYRRAYYDDGTPLGSAQNSECRLDALAQAWAVMSGVAPPARAAQAMDAVEAQLVDREAGLIRLLTPPFDRDPHDPGYIKGYVPGIRENGGQYTHAAMWAIRAMAELGRRDRAAAYLEMLSPVTHGGTPERLATYQVEPYVVVADIYGVAPHRGRGGWTWYTGSAAWMFRVVLETILGIRIEEGTTLVVDPRIPDHWPRFRVRLRLSDDRTVYDIIVENPQGKAAVVLSVNVDGQAEAVVTAGPARLPLIKDGAVHAVRITLGPR